MEEIVSITQLKDEPLAMMVFGAVVFYKIIGELAKHIIPLITKKKKKSVEEILADDAEKRKERQVTLDTKLNEIEASINKLFSIVADYEEFSNELSQETLENKFFNENRSIFGRLKAFLQLIAIRVNGRVREQGFNLILCNKETWRNVLEAKIDLKIVDQKYFDEVMEDINRRIFHY